MKMLTYLQIIVYLYTLKTSFSGVDIQGAYKLLVKKIRDILECDLSESVLVFYKSTNALCAVFRLLTYCYAPPQTFLATPLD